MGSLITREKEYTHTRTHMRVHRGWHFLSAPLFPPPGSPWHQRQQDSLPAGGNERSSWREEARGDQEEKGRRLMLRRAPWHNSPPHPTNPISPPCVDGIWIHSAWLHLQCPQLGMMSNMICFILSYWPIFLFLRTGQIYSLKINDKISACISYRNTCYKALINMRFIKRKRKALQN